MLMRPTGDSNCIARDAALLLRVCSRRTAATRLLSGVERLAGSARSCGAEANADSHYAV